MSPIHTNKFYKFRNALLTLLFILIAVFLVGVLTRSPSVIDDQFSIVSCISEIDQAITEMEESIDGIKARLSIIEARVDELESQDEKEDGHISEETDAFLEPLVGPALYASYADEITRTIYPDIPSDYVKAIIWRESRYQPDTKNSKTGVVGLMQINPKWHTQRANSLGVSDLFDPYGNIVVGCDILHEMTEQHEFNYALNFFAGGYKYADHYKNSTSPVVRELNDIIQKMKSGEIVIGGE